MNFLKSILKRKWRTDIILVVLLIILSFYAWRLLPEQYIRGGSLVYLTSYQQNSWYARAYPYTGFQTSAILASTLSTKLFGANMSLYWWAELVVMFVTYVFFYIFIKVVTKRSFAAFAATLIFAVNYFGNFNMAVDCYCHLAERTIVVPLLLISFTFLHLFLEKTKKYFFVLSLAFYFLAIGLAHFNLLFTAPYVLYPIFWYLFNHKKIKDILKGLLIGLSYMGISVFFVLIQNIADPGVNGLAPFFQYLFHPQKYHYLEYMLRQLVYWSQYPPIIDSLLHSYTNELQNVVGVLNAIQITPFISVVYIFASIYIYKKLPKQRAMLFTVIFATAIIFYLNAWFGQYFVAQQVGSNRYLYLPTILLAIFWSFFLWAAFWRQKRFYIIALLILTIYFYINTILLNDSFFTMTWQNDHTKVLTDHFVSIRKNLAKNTLIVTEFPVITYWEAAFYTDQLGKGEVRIMTEDDSSWKDVATTSAHVIRLEYDKECKCAKETKLK